MKTSPEEGTVRPFHSYGRTLHILFPDLDQLRGSSASRCLRRSPLSASPSSSYARWSSIAVGASSRTGRSTSPAVVVRGSIHRQGSALGLPALHQTGGS